MINSKISFGKQDAGDMFVYSFKRLEDARKKALYLKRKYGYLPEVMEISKGGKFLAFELVEPKGMYKI